MVSSTTTALAELGNIAFGGGGQKFAKIISVAGDTRELVAAVTGSKIRVLSLALEQEPNASGTFQFASASTVITGVFKTISQRAYVVMPFSPAGWFETAAGEALNVIVGGTDLGGCLVYEEVAAD